MSTSGREMGSETAVLLPRDGHCGGRRYTTARIQKKVMTDGGKTRTREDRARLPPNPRRLAAWLEGDFL